MDLKNGKKHMQDIQKNKAADFSDKETHKTLRLEYPTKCVREQKQKKNAEKAKQQHL
jgi:hypothetical protein